MFKTYSEINLEWLKNNCERIYFFGLGFIQVKINDEYRLHFYHPSLPAFVESPHNHRYNFNSRILKGEFTNILYQVTEGNTHQVSFESCNEAKPMGSEPQPKSLTHLSTTTFTKGQSYSMNHESFHVAMATNCITLLRRGPYEKELAEVALLSGQEKICPFSQKIPEERLWDLVKEMLEV